MKLQNFLSIVNPLLPITVRSFYTADINEEYTVLYKGNIRDTPQCIQDLHFASCHEDKDTNNKVIGVTIYVL